MNLVMKDLTTNTTTATTVGNVSESDEEEPERGWRVSPLPEGNGHTMELTRLLEGDERSA